LTRDYLRATREARNLRIVYFKAILRPYIDDLAR